MSKLVNTLQSSYCISFYSLCLCQSAFEWVKTDSNFLAQSEIHKMLTQDIFNDANFLWIVTLYPTWLVSYQLHYSSSSLLCTILIDLAKCSIRCRYCRCRQRPGGGGGTSCLLPCKIGSIRSCDENWNIYWSLSQRGLVSQSLYWDHRKYNFTIILYKVITLQLLYKVITFGWSRQQGHNWLCHSR